MADKLFAEPKKYQKDDFFDSMTEHKEERGYKGDRDKEERGEYRPRRAGRGGGFKPNYNNRNDNRGDNRNDNRGDNRNDNRG